MLGSDVAEKGQVVVIRERPLSSSDEAATWVVIGLDILKFVCAAGISIYGLHLTTKLIRQLMGPIEEASASAHLTKKALAKRLERPEVVDMEFDSYELSLLNDILGPGEIKVTFSDIGGMEVQLDEVRDNIVMPMQLWTRYRKVGVLSSPLPCDRLTCYSH